MPFALHSTLTGEIKTVLYQIPANPAQLQALADDGMAFVQVPNDVNPHNSIIDLNTGNAMLTRAPRKEYHLYQYAGDGRIQSTLSGHYEDGNGVLSVPNQIVSEKALPLSGGMILTLDDNGMPTKDGDGNYIAAPRPVYAEPVNINTLVAKGLIEAGHIDKNIIPDDVLAELNATLATADIPPITKG